MKYNLELRENKIQQSCDSLSARIWCWKETSDKVLWNPLFSLARQLHFKKMELKLCIHMNFSRYSNLVDLLFSLSEESHY